MGPDLIVLYVEELKPGHRLREAERHRMAKQATAGRLAVQKHWLSKVCKVWLALRQSLMGSPRVSEHQPNKAS